MSIQSFDDFEAETDNYAENHDTGAESSQASRLERRRRIEEIAEEKRLREELNEYHYE